jgi:thiamine biosynthesis lipoprotein
VNLNALVLSKDRLEKTADIAVNLSAVAKGYAVDQVALYLDAQRIEHYLVEVGGELRAKGMSPRGSHWRIGIERPDSLMRNAQVALPLVNKAVATSGDYRNYVEKDGKRYSHTIDPRTGWPIDHKVASVTVVHDESAFADAWATALMVPGLTEGQKLAEQHGLAVFWIVRSEDGFDTAMSSAYQRYTEALEQ